MANQSVQAFKRRLAQIPPKAKREAYAKLLEGAREMAGAMRSAAPTKSGALAGSIRIETEEANLRVFLKAGGAATTREVRKGSGVSFDYARAQEFGTSDQPAQPFFWPSYRLLKKRVRSRAVRAIGKALKNG